MGRTEIKICGITNPAEVEYLIDNNVNYAGMVLFFEKSKRNIDLIKAKSIIEQLPPDISSVAVVVSPTLEQIKSIIETGFKLIQIHGDIPDNIDSVIALPYAVPGNAMVKVWKAFNVDDVDKIDEYMDCNFIDGFVFDAAKPGSGKVFDWGSIDNIKCGDKKLILAGGLCEDNVAEAIKFVNPDVVDVSSGVEFRSDIEKQKYEEKTHKIMALKNPERIKAFADAVSLK